MTGKEIFAFDGETVGFDFLDFWKFHYSNIYDLQDKIADLLTISNAVSLTINSMSALLKRKRNICLATIFVNQTNFAKKIDI